MLFFPRLYIPLFFVFEKEHQKWRRMGEKGRGRSGRKCSGKLELGGVANEG